MLSRLLTGAALALIAVVSSIACERNDNASNTPTAAVATVTPGTSPTPAVPLSQRIGVRAGLPENDPVDLAGRYWMTNAARSKPFAGEANVGDTRDFFVQQISAAAYSGDEPPEYAVVSATLVAKSENAYFYADSALGVDTAGAQPAAAAFEDRVWPAVTQVFGTPATPGVDGDPRIIILQADLGSAVGGYYSPDDSYLRAVRPQSNEAEMLYIDQSVPIGGATFNVVLAHELQHLIHGNVDAGEEAWVNEGLSEAASALVGGAQSSLEAFAATPSIQLNAWASEGSAAHYGAGAAFTRYLAYRFGGDAALGQIARARGDGAAGIEEFLQRAAGSITFRAAFADWIAANALDRVEGPFSNPGAPLNIRVEDELTPGAPLDGVASQFGTKYYALGPADPATYLLRFNGATDVEVLPPSALESGAVLWSNAEDDIDTSVTRAVDLTDAIEPVLTFRTWFDIEPWYDWGYVAVSTDGGTSWRALAGQQTTDEDPVAAAYGPGYTDTSGGADEPQWVDERISLADFAGQRVLLRFEYVTDGSTHGQGWAVRDLAIDDAGFTDADGSDSAWEFDGWTRIDQPLPQAWIVRLIAEDAQGSPVVRDMQVAEDGGGRLSFDATGLRDVVVAVAGATEGTTQPAPYTIELLRQ